MSDTKERGTWWQMTVFEGQWPMLQTMPPCVAEWGWQDEVTKEGRLHKQAWCRTKIQMRKSAMIKVFPGIHIELARDKNALKAYSRKSETAIPGTQVHQVAEADNERRLTMARALTLLARYAMSEIVWQMAARTPQEFEQAPVKQFWAAVTDLLTTDNDAVGLFTQPQYQRAWVNTNEVWIGNVTKEIEELGGLDAPGEEDVMDIDFDDWEIVEPTE